MHRNALISKLKAYNPESEIEKEFRVNFLQFVNDHIDCFERSLTIGHVTGSCWIVNKERTKFLLAHHKKLNRWLQLGGHADGENDVIKVAKTEAWEESGLKSITLLSQEIFDIDIHTIPARKADPEHLHYDVRFLFEADDQEQLTVSEESMALDWISYNKLEEFCDKNDSIIRMAKKIIKK